MLLFLIFTNVLRLFIDIVNAVVVVVSFFHSIIISIIESIAEG